MQPILKWLRKKTLEINQMLAAIQGAIIQGKIVSSQ